MAINPNRLSRGVVPDYGRVLFTAKKGGRAWTLHIQPKPNAIDLARHHDANYMAPTSPLLLAQADAAGGWLEVYPINTTSVGRGLFEPKYRTLRSIRFDKQNMLDAETLREASQVLGKLPNGFVTTAAAGLGVDHELISIVYEFESANITHLIIRSGVRKGLPILVGRTLTIAAVQFDELRRAVRRIHDRALDQADDEKHRIVHNTVLTAVDPKVYPEEPAPYRKGAIVAAIRAGTVSGLNTRDQDATLAAMAPVAKAVAARKPEFVQTVVREIETANLEALIERFESKLAGNHGEAVWQAFFKDHGFILKLAFGYPVLAMGDQISVGGGRFDGRGEKVADFVVKAALSGNLALIEIKTPGTTLLRTAKRYRDGVFAPSLDLAGSVTQILDQRYQLQMNFAGKKLRSKDYDLEAYAIQCLVVIGSNPTVDDEKKSLELFRLGLRDVTIVTFQELLAKLKTILEFLQAEAPTHLTRVNTLEADEDMQDDIDDISDADET